jgi:ankyrin repeat protein
MNEMNKEMMELLCQLENIDVNVTLNSGHAPLSWASREGSQGLVRSLLERDVDAFGLTANDCARRERHPAVAGIF